MGKRLKMEIRGAVQGVGFRPFVYRLATELGLAGWVLNDIRGVFLEVEGDPERLSAFRERLRVEAPPRARIQDVNESWLDPVGYEGFEIRTSEAKGTKTVLVLPDIATCPDCLAEVLDPGTAATATRSPTARTAGRASRSSATCPTTGRTRRCAASRCARDCRAEYENPRDRRFHAQPNACPACGPAARRSGRGPARRSRGGDEALAAAARRARAGATSSRCKGLGGFHLMCDARDEAAVARLRERKAREESRFALMVRDLARPRGRSARSPPRPAALLESPEAPIVLLPPPRRRGRRAGRSRRGSPSSGVMLPATPLHHLLLRAIGLPARRHERQPERRADLHRRARGARAPRRHRRPLPRARPPDRAARGRQRRADRRRARRALLRRARGFAPLPVPRRRGAARRSSPSART